MLVFEIWILLSVSFLQIDADLVLSTMRSAVEQQLTLIAQGKANFHEVKQHALDIFHLKFRYFVSHIYAMDELFEVSFSSLADTGRPLSRFVAVGFEMRICNNKLI